MLLAKGNVGLIVKIWKIEIWVYVCVCFEPIIRHAFHANDAISLALHPATAAFTAFTALSLSHFSHPGWHNGQSLP